MLHDISATTGQRTAMLRELVRRNISVAIGLALIAITGAVALAAPMVFGDPSTMSTAGRLQHPSLDHWFGTDLLGRDVLARTAYGGRISLVVGFLVAVLSVIAGLMIGLLAGYYRRVDTVVMRFMDATMAIPSMLLAIALVAVTKGGIAIVIVAIAIPEIPRVVRLVRSVVLSTRELPFVEAAIASGSSDLKIIRRHIFPSTVAPLIVLATYVMASAILIEAGLSFLGIGIPPEVPTWGNMISAHRSYLAYAPNTIFFPSAALTAVVLAVNLLGDGLRDRLDPKLSRRM